MLGLEHFFRSTKLIFWALPNHYEDPRLINFSPPQVIFFKKQAKKGVFMHFSENFGQKIAFFRRVLPHQNEYILTKKAPLEQF